MPNVILATSGYDHTIKFWEAPSGICYRTIQLNPDSVRRERETAPPCLATHASYPTTPYSYVQACVCWVFGDR